MSGDTRQSAEIARLRATILAMPEPRRSVYLLCARDRLDYDAVAGWLGLTIREVDATWPRPWSFY